jgi:hypothetical protein
MLKDILDLDRIKKILNASIYVYSKIMYIYKIYEEYGIDS